MLADDIRGLLGSGDALIVVPPFAGLDRPSLAAHTLQACAKKAGFEVRVLYANLLLASEIGDTTYEAICYASTSALLGERFFARSAYGAPSLGRDDLIVSGALGQLAGQVDLSTDGLRAIEARIGAWCDDLAAVIATCGFPIVGFSTTFEQTAASIALLNRVKRISPQTIVLLGGANCEDEMAEGILSLGSSVDYVFSGESEETFPKLLRQIAAGERPVERIVAGQPCRDLDSIPTPDFDEFFKQRNRFIPESAYASADMLWIPYEASRGCWWGEKHHCTFCGINGQGMEFRQKSAERVISELGKVIENCQVRRICMTDNIMPYRYFQTLIPSLGERVPGLQLFYEQKANLTLDQVFALKKAGVMIVQPGIEALSTPLLKLMDKGVTARQNIALMRYARATGVQLNWNLLYGFPGDDAEDYRKTLGLIALMRHLNPPSDLCRLSIDRFSPYFFAFSKYGIRSITPMASYESVLPDAADIRKVAYHFVGDYESGSLSAPQLMTDLENEIGAWKQRWAGEDTEPPHLGIIAFSAEQFAVMDSRGLPNTKSVEFITRELARAALVAHPMTEDCPASEWARSRFAAVDYEGWHIPLATASVDVLQEFENQAKARPKPESAHKPELQRA